MSPLAPVPAHIDPALVVDFDYIQPEGLDEGDVFSAFARLHAGPDIVWTPHYGGHWIATRGEDIQWIQERHELFSNAEKNVPKGSFPSMPPITENPPNHSRYRAVLNPYFTRSRIEAHYEASARGVIVDLIEAIKPQGRAEMVSANFNHRPTQDFLGFCRSALRPTRGFSALGPQFRGARRA